MLLSLGSRYQFVPSRHPVQAGSDLETTGAGPVGLLVPIRSTVQSKIACIGKPSDMHQAESFVVHTEENPAKFAGIQ